MKETLVRKLARVIAARQYCIDHDKNEWLSSHEAKIEELVGMLPSGSGIDSGNSIDYDNSTPEMIVIISAYHCMRNSDSYNHWIDYCVIVTPSLVDGHTVNVIGDFKEDPELNGYLTKLYGYRLGLEI